MTYKFFGRKCFTPLLSLSVLAIISFSACQKEPTPATRPIDPNAPIITPQDIAAGVLKDAQLDGPLPRRGSKMPKLVRRNVLDLLRREKVSLAGTPEGDVAIQIIKKKIDERIRDFERAELWEHVLTYSEAHLIFSPNSKKFIRARETALTELRKPRVTVTGLPVFDGHKLAMLNIYIPMSSKTYREQLAIGEEKHGIRVLSVYGDDLGVQIEYLETGERFIAYLPGVK